MATKIHKGGFIEEEVDSALDGTLAVRRQFTQIGSFAHAEDPEGLLGGLTDFTLFAHVHPTLIKSERQMIMGRWEVNTNSGYGLGINPEGRLSLWVGDGQAVDRITADTPVHPRCWLFVTATFEAATGATSQHVIDCINPWNSRFSTVVPFELGNWITETLSVRPSVTEGAARFLLAGASESNPKRGPFVSMLFNGKIDRSGVYARTLTRNEIEVLAGGAPPSDKGLGSDGGTGGERHRRHGPNGLDMVGVNRPVRCMTGYNWNGADSFHLAPDEYGGVHFHDDALTDCDWDVTCSLDLPEKLKSGVYALRLTAGITRTTFPSSSRPTSRGKGLRCYCRLSPIWPTPTSTWPTRRPSPRRSRRTLRSSPRTIWSLRSWRSSGSPPTITTATARAAAIPVG